MTKVWIENSRNYEDRVLVEKTMFLKFAKAALKDCTHFTKHGIKQHIEELMNKWLENNEEINDLQNQINETFNEIEFTKAVNDFITDQEPGKIEL